MHERVQAVFPDVPAGSPAAESTAGSVLDLRDIAVRRGPTLLLDRVSLRLSAGERWVIVGPNGAGKSTLLAVAATTLSPTTGSVDVLGKRMGRVDGAIAASADRRGECGARGAVRADIDRP